VSGRKSLSKTTRFRVFKRDGFKCQYCGNTPPDAVLEVDHVHPIALGGDDDEANLITACFSCNRGKSAEALDVAPESIAARAERMAEAEEQFTAYRALVMSKRVRLEECAWDVIRVLFNSEKTTTTRLETVKRFVGRLPLDEVLEAADIARSVKPYSDPERFKYFCGICWNKIRARES
jgi:hypothetical protein